MVLRDKINFRTLKKCWYFIFTYFLTSVSAQAELGGSAGWGKFKLFVIKFDKRFVHALLLENSL